jgi:hypothetical protein
MSNLRQASGEDAPARPREIAELFDIARERFRIFE